jgi:hypothetical protein
MGTTEPPNRIDRHRNGYCPSDGDDDPATVLPLGSTEYNVRNHAIAEQDQEHRAQQLRKKILHGAESSVDACT